MLSRTSARQQRMREQTLNEERMSNANHIQEFQRTCTSGNTSERRSSASKLIISSPTPGSASISNIPHQSLLPSTLSAIQPVTVAIPGVDVAGTPMVTSVNGTARGKMTSSNRGLGTSALMTFLSGHSNQRQVNNNSNLTESTDTSAGIPITSRLSQLCGVGPQLAISPKRSDEIAIAAATASSPMADPLSSSPMDRRLHQTHRQPQQQRQSLPGSTRLSVHSHGAVGLALSTSPYLSGELGRLSTSPSVDDAMYYSSRSNFKMIPQPSTATGLLPRLPCNEVLEMVEDSNELSPSSGVNSPMESFANIAEEQNSDSFDLNNITPSIQLSASVGITGDFLDYADERSLEGVGRPIHQTGSGDGFPSKVASPCLISATGDAVTNLSTIIKPSTSCPAGIQDPGVPSPHTLSNDSKLHNPQVQLVTGAAGAGIPLGSADMMPAGRSSQLQPQLFSLQSTTQRGADDQRVAWMRDRTKKDSHNRIERKRRDYINSQITELGNLLPEEMFRDGDCKKNKGSILKNSVEFICLLRSQLAHLPDVRKETSLAAKVITELHKRVQELEGFLRCQPSHQQVSSSTSPSECQQALHEWLSLHEYNHQFTVGNSDTKSSFSGHSAQAQSQQQQQQSSHVSDAPGSSSPGLSSVGTEELLVVDPKSSLFTSHGAMAASAPGPSDPLSSPLSYDMPLLSSSVGPSGEGGGAAAGVGGGACSSLLGSPLRVVRSRCTSLTVTGPSGTSPPEFSLPIDHQQYQLNQQQQQQQQRLAGGTKSRSFLGHQMIIASTPGGSGLSGLQPRGPVLLRTAGRSAWPVTSSHTRRVQMAEQIMTTVPGGAMAAATTSPANNAITAGAHANGFAPNEGLSASLPANMGNNPLTGYVLRLAELDPGTAPTQATAGTSSEARDSLPVLHGHQQYPFDPDDVLIPGVKREPPSEPDSRLCSSIAGGGGGSSGCTGNSYLDSLSEVGYSSRQGLREQTPFLSSEHRHHHHLQQQQAQSSSTEHPPPGRAGEVSMTLDSPGPTMTTHMTFDADSDAEFNDAPME